MDCRTQEVGEWWTQPKIECQKIAEENGQGHRQAAAGAEIILLQLNLFFSQKIVALLMAAGRVAASDQQMKELLQEVTRLQSLGNLIKTLGEKERNQIKLKDESVKVRD